MKYRIGEKLQVDRHGPDQLELKMGNEKAVVFTEDLVALVAHELPEDRAAKLLEGIDERMVRKGKVRVVVAAKKDILKGEPVCFVLDITRYLDSAGMPMGIRATKGGILL